MGPESNVVSCATIDTIVDNNTLIRVRIHTAHRAVSRKLSIFVKQIDRSKMAELSGLKLEQRHGKSRVRVARVWKSHNGKHHFTEWSVNISLLSDCLPAYVAGDNSDIVATDTMKNTVSLLFFFV